MGLRGKNTKSIRSKSLTNTRNPVVGVKNIKFYHQANKGETIIDITSLTAPSGLVNPSPSTILKARLKDFSENIVKFDSSAKGTLMEGTQLGYSVVSNTTIKLNFEAEENEIFEIVFSNAIVNGTVIADVRTPSASGTLLEAQTDFALGEAIEIKYLSNDWPIQVFRGNPLVPQKRNTLNGLTGGDYQMLDNGDGFSSTLKFNVVGGVGGETVVWSSNGAVGERPNLSVLQQVDSLNGIMDKMADDLLEVTGNDIADPTRYSGIPSNIDLKAFGDKVQTLLKILDVEIFPNVNIFTIDFDASGNPIDNFKNAITLPTNSSAGIYGSTINASVFTGVDPKVTATVNGIFAADIGVTITAGVISIEINNNGTKTNSPFTLTLTRRGADYKDKVKISTLI